MNAKKSKESGIESAVVAGEVLILEGLKGFPYGGGVFDIEFDIISAKPSLPRELSVGEPIPKAIRDAIELDLYSVRPFLIIESTALRPHGREYKGHLLARTPPWD